MMKTIGIKLADGSFYSVLQEDTLSEKTLELTTVHNNQTKVMVDLYRSEACSMDDAEYVDSLQIENLVAHPNGEPDIIFTVSLDEQNKLSAKIVDLETGNQSNTTITLVNRPASERVSTDEYAIKESGIGLLATAEAIRNAMSEEKSAKEPVPIEKPVVSEEADEAIPPTEEQTPAQESLAEENEINKSGDDMSDSEKKDDFDLDGLPDIDNELDSSLLDLPDLDSNMDDFNLGISDDEQSEPTETAPTESESLAEAALTEDFASDIDTFGTSSAEIDASESDSTEGTAQDFTTDDFSTDLNLPDFPESSTDTTSDFSTEESASSIDDLDLPDFPEDEPSEEPLPSFDDLSSSADLPSSESTDLDLPDFPDTFDSEEQESPDFGSFDLPDDTEPEPASAAGGFDFAGLYDNEDVFEDEEESSSKGTKLPLVICIICAIICVLATLALLFIIPSKFNLLNKSLAEKEAPVVQVAQAEPELPVTPEPQSQEPEPLPEPEPIPQAKEDEIIIIERAEEVIPEQPPVVEEKPVNITYKIKWGDTLWDIADTYYKNPWRYKEIARFNGIKDPDHIVSGTIIIIPAE